MQEFKMSNSYYDKLLNCLIKRVGENPGFTAKMLVREINKTRKFIGYSDYITKKDINPTLYGKRDVFRYEGLSPPRWFLLEQSPTVTSTDMHDKVDPSILDELLRFVNFKPAEREVLEDKHDRICDTPIDSRQLIKPRELTEIIDVSPKLYEWQQNAIEYWKHSNGQGIVQAVTGSGKTLVALELISKYVTAGRRCLVVVPSTVLLEQWKVAIELELNIQDISIVGGNFGNIIDIKAPIILGTVQTLRKLTSELEGQIHLLIADEVHRYGAPRFREILLNTTPHRIGLTATFERNDDGLENVLQPYFSKKVFEYDFGQAKQDGVISPYTVGLIGVELNSDEKDQYKLITDEITDYRKKLESMLGIPSSNKDFFNEVANAVKWPDKLGNTARSFLTCIHKRKLIVDTSEGKLQVVRQLGDSIANASKTILFCSSIKVAEQITMALLDIGIDAADYHSKLTDEQKQEVLEMLQDGEIQVIVAVKALDEGIDIPDLDMGIIVSGSKQRRQMIQRMGRIVRRKDDNRGATFLVIYAEETAEDPAHTIDNEKEGYLDLLLEHSNRTEYFNLQDVNDGVVEKFVHSSIWLSGSDPNQTRRTPRPKNSQTDSLDDDIPF